MNNWALFFSIISYYYTNMLRIFDIVIQELKLTQAQLEADLEEIINSGLDNKEKSEKIVRILNELSINTLSLKTWLGYIPVQNNMEESK